MHCNTRMDNCMLQGHRQTIQKTHKAAHRPGTPHPTMICGTLHTLAGWSVHSIGLQAGRTMWACL